jgi:hypothetical protein
MRHRAKRRLVRMPRDHEVVGIPDGLGATFGPNGDDLRLFMNHELRIDQGMPRAHGVAGAFVSKWTIDSDTLDASPASSLRTRCFPANRR